ncbi:ligand-dependent nuclear receptor-interacting factor 1 [Rhinatrema bivittatum]|uniref:ligand-dependent nuclear receptor-interacting factor 1 n=1 Tax=Rhinatrema bivittatum TaxID=194408 RepID=UPI00112B39C8|nr:ligand-dependent nuclear receptor-interacting factor 1 [Rhinatrema bivittatum]
MQRLILPGSEPATGAGHSLAGCVYQLVQNIGPDGANLLKLIPVPKSSGNQLPLVQNAVFSEGSKGNTANPVRIFQAQLPSCTTASSLQVPVYQQTNATSYVLTRQVGNADTSAISSVKKGCSSSSSVQSNSVVLDKPSLQKICIPPSNQGDKAYMLVNTKNLPLTVKSPVLPTGHHLQIPAHAEVKSVSASCLPPAIQQKIFTAAVSNASEMQEVKNVPTVIYVSPVNTVRTVVSQQLQNICPKTEIIMTKTQTANATASVGQQSQGAPMKWVVQENPQSSSSPCLVPVKSSNNMASKILKSLAEMRNIEYNSANILPLCSSSGAPINKISPIKDNALVMCNGKVYLLAKKGSDILTGETDKQSQTDKQSLQCVPTANEALPRKATELPNSDSVAKLTSEVVNIVLSKTKSVNVPSNPKGDPNAETALHPRVRSSVKLETDGAKKVYQHTSGTASHLASLSTMQAAPSVKSAANRKDLLEEENSGLDSASKGTADASSHPKQHWDALVKEEQIQVKIMDPLEEDTLTISRRKDTLLKRRFGIFKDARVKLKRLPVPSLLATSGSRSTDSEISRDFGKDITGPGEEPWKEDEVVSTPEQAASQKRKLQILDNVESVKKKKTEKESTTSTSTILSGLKSACSSLQIFRRPATSHPPPPLSSVMLQDSMDWSPSSLPNPKQQRISKNETVAPEESTMGTSGASSPAEEDSPQPPPVPSEAVALDPAENFLPPPPLDPGDSFRDEKIRRLKELLREREEALEAIRRKMRK